MKLYLISGRARNGKGLVSEIMKEEYEKLGKKVCFIQVMRTLKGYLKDYFGWDGLEETKPREQLQVIGTDIIREKLNKPNFHIDRLIEDIEILENFFDIFIVTDIRLPLEITSLKQRFPGTTSINVTRENYIDGLTDKQKVHITETALNGYHDFDYELINNNIDQLKIDIKTIIDSEVKKDEKND